MPLPLVDCADDVPTDVCCPTLYGIADRIRCIATNAVLRCLTGDCAEREFRSIIAMDPHPDFCGDILTVALTSWGVDQASTENGRTLPVLLTVADYHVELREAGWPTIELDEQSDLIVQPDADLVNALALHVYAHGESMYRALLDVAARRSFWTSEIGLPTDRFSNFQVSPLRPLPPQLHVAGWQLDVRVRWNPGPGMAAS
jgi:hypothetical protein